MKYFIASPTNINFALALANRAVVLFKIKEFKMAIEDINAAIKSNQYPDENVHKLYQRLAKSYEHLQESEKAVNCYAKLESSLTLSKLTKVQKLQIMDESEKSVGLCKTAIIAKDVTDVNKMDKDRSESNFPCYKALHGEIKNASGEINQ